MADQTRSFMTGGIEGSGGGGKSVSELLDKTIRGLQADIVKFGSQNDEASKRTVDALNRLLESVKQNIDPKKKLVELPPEFLNLLSDTNKSLAKISEDIRQDVKRRKQIDDVLKKLAGAGKEFGNQALGTGPIGSGLALLAGAIDPKLGLIVKASQENSAQLMLMFDMLKSIPGVREIAAATTVAVLGGMAANRLLLYPKGADHKK